ncbi:MAG: 50S ribosomal protein L23 [Gemmataceae bacterium]|nr:50S ribosomal protein L23 [Gemmataceae bacterium]
MAITTPRETRGPQLEPHQVLLRPLISEKGTHQSTRHRAYAFEVNPWAEKGEIKAAVEELFGVRVEKVRTQNRAGKKRRTRTGIGRLANWKKAIVTLREDSPQIDFF